MDGIIQGVINILAGICSGITTLLPTSPFKTVSEIVIDSEILQFIAWLVPFPQIVTLLEVWVSCVAVFYAWQLVLRWIKLIQ